MIAELARFLSGKGNADGELGHLRRSATYDLTHPDVYYVAGRLLERRNRLEESKAAYRRQIEINPMHARARFDLGRVLFKQGRVDTATTVWRQLMESRPTFRRICMQPLLEAYINTGETGKAQAVIAEELRVLDPDVRARMEDISLVAGPGELAEYNSLAEEDRPGFVRSFWQMRDPTPATPGNERLVEHYRRVVYSLQNYSKDGQTWDRRGEVYSVW